MPGYLAFPEVEVSDAISSDQFFTPYQFPTFSYLAENLSKAQVNFYWC